MSTDAGSAAAPEDAATREESSERPGLESADPQSADSATSTPETADPGVEGSADPDGHADTDEGAGETDDAAVDDGSDESTDQSTEDGDEDSNPASEGFLTSILRDSTITGLPGETGAPPAEPHSPEAQQEGDEPVGAEPRQGDNPDGVD